MEETYQVRVPKKAYQLLRKEAFRLHRPMTQVLEAAIYKWVGQDNESRTIGHN